MDAAKESEVARMLGEGTSGRAISKALGIPETTVREIKKALAARNSPLAKTAQNDSGSQITQGKLSHWHILPKTKSKHSTQ